jgi:hypothetical protein
VRDVSPPPARHEVVTATVVRPTPWLRDGAGTFCVSGVVRGARWGWFFGVEEWRLPRGAWPFALPVHWQGWRPTRPMAVAAASRLAGSRHATSDRGRWT